MARFPGRGEEGGPFERATITFLMEVFTVIAAVARRSSIGRRVYASTEPQFRQCAVLHLELMHNTLNGSTEIVR